MSIPSSSSRVFPLNPVAVLLFGALPVLAACKEAPSSPEPVDSIATKAAMTGRCIADEGTYQTIHFHPDAGELFLLPSADAPMRIPIHVSGVEQGLLHFTYKWPDASHDDVLRVRSGSVRASSDPGTLDFVFDTLKSQRCTLAPDPDFHAALDAVGIPSGTFAADGGKERLRLVKEVQKIGVQDGKSPWRFGHYRIQERKPGGAVQIYVSETGTEVSTPRVWVPWQIELEGADIVVEYPDNKSQRYSPASAVPAKPATDQPPTPKDGGQPVADGGARQP